MAGGWHPLCHGGMGSETSAGVAEATDRLLTVQEVARRLAVSRWTVYRLVRTGDLQKIRVGGSIRFRAADVETLIQRGARP